MPEESTSDVEVEALAQPSQSPEEGVVFVLENASLEVAKVGKVSLGSRLSAVAILHGAPVGPLNTAWLTGLPAAQLR